MKVVAGVELRGGVNSPVKRIDTNTPTTYSQLLIEKVGLL